MSRGHMLPYPLMAQAVTNPAIAAVAADVRRRNRSAGAPLQAVLTHLLSEVLREMARQARGSEAAADTAFRVGAALFAHDLTEDALWRIENEVLMPLCNGDGTDSIYEELQALGQRALTEGEIVDGMLRIP
jgi:hypothetical protein